MDTEREKDEEDHLREVDRILLYISEAKVRAERGADELARDGADERIVMALRTAATAMTTEHKRLMNSTFYSLPYEQEQLDVRSQEPEQGQLTHSQDAR